MTRDRTTTLLAAAVAVLVTAPAHAWTERTWRPEVSAGFDASTHTYSLAVDDTTETVAEALLLAALEGRSARRARQRWRLRLEGGLGTELTRQRLDAEYRLRDDGGRQRLRADLVVAARQYRPGSQYEYNSDNNEGLGELRAAPLAFGGVLGELRGWAGWHEYRTPSTLEVDDRRYGGAIHVRSRRAAERAWSAGLRIGRRVHPDSSAIDRDEIGLDLDWDSHGLDGSGLGVHHRTRRRAVADPTVRPDAWTHWTDADLSVPAGAGQVRVTVQSEIWDYAYESDVWFDSWRVEGFLGYRGGDLLTLGWQAGLAGAHLEAGDNPDTYTQLGVRGGLDSYTGSVGGTLTVEVGRRVYRDGGVATDIDELLGGFSLYSDFTYWKLWLVGQWYVSEAFSLEALASFEPENHTEPADDTALGFFNLRLVWRP